MHRLLIALLACLLSLPAAAGDMVLTWTHPTKNTDNTNIPASGPGSLTGTRVEWGTCSGNNFGTKAGEQVVAAPAATYTVTNLAPGKWCARVYARNTYSQESAPTNAVSKVLEAPTPNPPSDLTVRDLVVYQVIGTLDRIALLPVGTVPAGTTCDPTQTVNGFYAVPRAAVTWYGSVKPQVVVASCS